MGCLSCFDESSDNHGNTPLLAAMRRTIVHYGLKVYINLLTLKNIILMLAYHNTAGNESCQTSLTG